MNQQLSIKPKQLLYLTSPKYQWLHLLNTWQRVTSKKVSKVEQLAAICCFLQTSTMLRLSNHSWKCICCETSLLKMAIKFTMSFLWLIQIFWRKSLSASYACRGADFTANLVHVIHFLTFNMAIFVSVDKQIIYFTFDWKQNNLWSLQESSAGAMKSCPDSEQEHKLWIPGYVFPLLVGNTVNMLSR